MPQGPTHLHEMWQDDGKAMRFLEGNGYGISSKGFIVPGPNPLKSDEAISAIQYLCLEWDYAFEGFGNGPT